MSDSGQSAVPAHAADAITLDIQQIQQILPHRYPFLLIDRITGMEMKPSGDFELTFDTGQTAQGSRRYRSAVAALDRSHAST